MEVMNGTWLRFWKLNAVFEVFKELIDLGSLNVLGLSNGEAWGIIFIQYAPDVDSKGRTVGIEIWT